MKDTCLQILGLEIALVTLAHFLLASDQSQGYYSHKEVCQ